MYRLENTLKVQPDLKSASALLCTGSSGLLTSLLRFPSQPCKRGEPPRTLAFLGSSHSILAGLLLLSPQSGVQCQACPVVDLPCLFPAEFAVGHEFSPSISPHLRATRPAPVPLTPVPPSPLALLASILPTLNPESFVLFGKWSNSNSQTSLSGDTLSAKQLGGPAPHLLLGQVAMILTVLFKSSSSSSFFLNMSFQDLKNPTEFCGTCECPAPTQRKALRGL